MSLRRRRSITGFQRGVTLIELMVAMVISLIVSTAMVMLMANTMGTGTQTIQMTRLTQEMRTAMQLITRDLRRANFHSNSAACYGTINCSPDTTKIIAIVPITETCFRFWLDRESDGDLDAGAFQRYTRGSVNVLQMTMADDADDTCGDDWGVALDITDADIVNISAFTINDDDSYCANISPTDSQTISRIRLTMTGELQNTPQGIPISKTIEDMIYVRNPAFNVGLTCL
jgi:prepilin-type N-terminal cleavage/methylation domain-containing protein